MKRFLKIILLIPFLLVGCSNSGSEYDEVIDKIVEYHQDRWDYEPVEGTARDNADITVWDEGRYVRIRFIEPEGKESSKGTESFYEIVGDDIEWLKQYEGEQLMSKTPDYQEQLGKKLGQ